MINLREVKGEHTLQHSMKADNPRSPVGYESFVGCKCRRTQAECRNSLNYTMKSWCDPALFDGLNDAQRARMIEQILKLQKWRDKRWSETHLSFEKFRPMESVCAIEDRLRKVAVERLKVSQTIQKLHPELQASTERLHLAGLENQSYSIGASAVGVETSFSHLQTPKSQLLSNSTEEFSSPREQVNELMKIGSTEFFNYLKTMREIKKMQDGYKSFPEDEFQATPRHIEKPETFSIPPTFTGRQPIHFQSNDSSVFESLAQDYCYKKQSPQRPGPSFSRAIFNSTKRKAHWGHRGQLAKRPALQWQNRTTKEYSLEAYNNLSAMDTRFDLSSLLDEARLGSVHDRHEINSHSSGKGFTLENHQRRTTEAKLHSGVQCPQKDVRIKKPYQKIATLEARTAEECCRGQARPGSPKRRIQMNDEGQRQRKSSFGKSLDEPCSQPSQNYLQGSIGSLYPRNERLQTRLGDPNWPIQLENCCEEVSETPLGSRTRPIQIDDTNDVDYFIQNQKRHRNHASIKTRVVDEKSEKSILQHSEPKDVNAWRGKASKNTLTENEDLSSLQKSETGKIKSWGSSMDNDLDYLLRSFASSSLGHEYDANRDDKEDNDYPYLSSRSGQEEKVCEPTIPMESPLKSSHDLNKTFDGESVKKASKKTTKRNPVGSRFFATVLKVHKHATSVQDSKTSGGERKPALLNRHGLLIVENNSEQLGSQNGNGEEKSEEMADIEMERSNVSRPSEEEKVICDDNRHDTHFVSEECDEEARSLPDDRYFVPEPSAHGEDPQASKFLARKGDPDGYYLSSIRGNDVAGCRSSAWMGDPESKNRNTEPDAQVRENPHVGENNCVEESTCSSYRPNALDEAQRHWLKPTPTGMEINNSWISEKVKRREVRPTSPISEITGDFARTGCVRPCFKEN